MAWDQIKKERLATPKWVKNRTLTVLPTEPIETVIKGKYGPQTVWVVETSELGLVYVSLIQLMHIIDVFAGNYKEPVSIGF